MPPKKKGAAAKAKEEASRSTRATDPIVTSKRGTVYQSTAAATRPKHDTAVPSSPAPTLKKKTTTPASKKRGRPAQTVAEEEPTPKRGRNTATSAAVEEAADAPKKRGPGRPPKKATATKPAPVAPATIGKKRGRPSKADTADEEADEEEAPPPKKRGRPATANKEAPAVSEAEAPPPKKRGRPPKGGETTKVAADDEAAAEQLEEELEDTAEPAKATTSKRKAPAAKKGKGTKGKAPQTDVDEEGDVLAAEEDVEGGAGGKNYWLMKAEQEDREEILKSGRPFNTKFTIDDLRSKSDPEPWDGVRNPTAAKNMREMKSGDLAFFYASGGKSGRKPGIVGIMEIVKEHEPDATAWDEDAYGYVEDEAKRSRWCVVHVEFRKKLSKPVLLSELQKYSKEGGVLSHMQEFTAARLSVSKVTEKEWNFILENLVEGYEDDADEGSAAVPVLAPKPKGPDGGPGALEMAAVFEEKTTTVTQVNGDAVIEETTSIEKEIELPNGVPAIVSTTETTEVELPTTDGVLAEGTSATSRQGSRAGSRQPSNKLHSSRPASRAGSVGLAPGIGRGRSRSRTPNLANNPPAPTAQMVVEAIVEEEEVLVPA